MQVWRLWKAEQRRTLACLSSLAARRRLAFPFPMCVSKSQGMPEVRSYCMMPVQSLWQMVSAGQCWSVLPWECKARREAAVRSDTGSLLLKCALGLTQSGMRPWTISLGPLCRQE